jgi:hypothetical protein
VAGSVMPALTRAFVRCIARMNSCKSSARNQEHAIRRAIRRHHAPASRAHAMRSTQSGAQSDVITHLQVEHPVAVHVTEGPDLTKLGHAEPRLLEH